MPLLIGLGLALLLAAQLLYEGVQINRRMAQAIAQTRLVSIAELLTQFQPGIMQERMAAVRGAIACDQPLAAPHSGTACVAYRYTFTRTFEEAGEDGPRVASETLKHEERRTAFQVRDATGAVTVLPEGAELDLVVSAETREPERALSTGAHDQTLYYQHHEEVLVAGSEVYALGLASTPFGDVRVGQPHGWPSPFVVSRQAPHHLLTRAVDNVIARRAWAVVCAALGLGLLLTGLLLPH